MKAFISYSHNDKNVLNRLHVHLAQLKREGVLSSWTDEEILVGGNLNASISNHLQSSQLFIAILSPDYIASHYCYETEFLKAIEMESQGTITIVPIIAEPCDWLHTPFKEFKALPNDGKAISTWENANTPFLDITQNLRRLIETRTSKKVNPDKTSNFPSSRNYQFKKDFDSIQKLEFVEDAFRDLKDLIKRFLDELIKIDDNIKYKLLKSDENVLEYILVNRNKIGVEAKLQIEVGLDHSQQRGFNINQSEILYRIDQNRGGNEKGFRLANDDYHMFWSQHNYMYSSQQKEFTTKDIAEEIWDAWLNTVGII